MAFGSNGDAIVLYVVSEPRMAYAIIQRFPF